jgi:hypothetical protein
MPSTSDLNRYHQDSEYFVGQLDELLGATQAKGQAKPRIDPKTAQNRLQDLAKQIQGASITNQNSEEIKILNELTQGLADPRSFARSLGTVRNKYEAFKKQRDDLFRESVAVQADIEDKLGDEKANIERARKTLDETEKKFKDAAGGKGKKLEGYNELSSGLKKTIEKRTAKIESLQKQLERPDLSLKDIKEIQKELALAVESAKPEINKFKERSKEFLGQPQDTSRTAEETDEEAETEATKPRQTAEDEEAQSTEETQEAAEGTAEAKAEESPSAAPSTQAQAGRTSAAASPAQVLAPAAAAAAAVSVTTVGAPAAAGGQASVTATASGGTATQTTTATTQIEATSTAPAATSATVEVSADKLERAAQTRGISVTAESPTEAQSIPPEIAEIAVAYQAHLGTVQAQTQLLREAQAGDRPDIDQQQVMAQLEASYEAIGQERDKLKTFSQHAGTRSFQMLDTAMQRSENALLDVHANLEKGVRIPPANLSALGRTSSPGMAVSGGILKSAHNTAAMATPAAMAVPISSAVASAAEAAKGAALMSQRSAEAREGGSEEMPAQGPEPISGATPLAYRGPAPRPTPRMAPGTSIKPSAAMPLSASGTRAASTRPTEGLGGDTPITDQSIGLGSDEQRPSVLEEGVPLSHGPYAQGERFKGPMAGEEEMDRAKTLGGGEFMAGAEFASQQAKEKAALASQAMFTGIAGTALGSLAETASTETQEPEEQDEMEQMLGGDSRAGGGSQLDRGRQMVEDKVKDEVEKRLKQQLKNRLGQQAGKKAGQQAAQKVAQQAAVKGASASARVTIEGAEAVNTPDTIGITLAIMIIQMNVQMILKYLMKGTEMVTGTNAEEVASEQIGEGAGKGAGCITMFMQQTLAEDFLTLFLDCGLICLANPACWVAVIVIGVIFLIVAGTDSNVQDMLLLMAGG